MPAPQDSTWYITLIFSGIAVLAFLGNALVIYVLVKKSSNLKQPYNIFIFSLALTDLLTAVMLVFSRYIYLPPMPNGELSQKIYCPIIWDARALFMLGYVSVYSCLALTIERWLAVVKPQTYRAVKPSHAVKAIAVVWIWCLAISVGTFFRSKINPVKQTCIRTALGVANKEFLWLDFTLQTAIPLVLIVLLYSHIRYTMVRLPNMGSDEVKKTTFVAFMACSALIIGWMPGRINLILIGSGLVEDPGSYLLQYCLATLAFSNNCVNPFLYGICSPQFKKEYKAIFNKLFFFCKRTETQAQPALSNVVSQETANSSHL